MVWKAKGAVQGAKLTKLGKGEVAMRCPNCKSLRVLKIGEEPRGDIVECLDCGFDGVRAPHPHEIVER